MFWLLVGYASGKSSAPRPAGHSLGEAFLDVYEWSPILQHIPPVLALLATTITSTPFPGHLFYFGLRRCSSFSTTNRVSLLHPPRLPIFVYQRTPGGDSHTPVQSRLLPSFELETQHRKDAFRPSSYLE